MILSPTFPTKVQWTIICSYLCMLNSCDKMSVIGVKIYMSYDTLGMYIICTEYLLNQHDGCWCPGVYLTPGHATTMLTCVQSWTILKSECRASRHWIFLKKKQKKHKVIFALSIISHHFKMAQVIKFSSWWKTKPPPMISQSAPWLLMDWQCKEPGHQEPWYWPPLPEIFQHQYHKG